MQNKVEYRDNLNLIDLTNNAHGLFPFWIEMH